MTEEYVTQKEQDKTLEEELSSMERGNLPESKKDTTQPTLRIMRNNQSIIIEPKIWGWFISIY